MDNWESRDRDAVAPDSMDVWLLERVTGASSAIFRAKAGQTCRAVRHRTVEEIWYCLSGKSEMWMQAPDGSERTVSLTKGRCIAIPVATAFQLRNRRSHDATFFGVTVPAWPGDSEAEITKGKWLPRMSGV
jgi:mannose-6-phosphate isomerase-like protein (cupin superfamily)